MIVTINSHAALFWFLLGRLRNRNGLGRFPETILAYAASIIARLADLASISDGPTLGQGDESCPTGRLAAGPWPSDPNQDSSLRLGHRSMVALAIELSGLRDGAVSMDEANMIMADMLGLQREGLLIIRKRDRTAAYRDLVLLGIGVHLMGEVDT